MQRREQYLLGGLVAALVIWQASGWVSSAVFGPFETRRDELNRLRETVGKKSNDLLGLARAGKQLGEWRSISLPPDEIGKSKQPNALDAQRLYLQWLTNLAQLCGFESLKVLPGSVAKKGNIYFSVIVKVEADARYEQLVRFLDLFYRTRLLHRVSSLNVSTKVFDGDPVMRISFDAEGLALLDAKPRRTLFPQTKLTTSLAENGTSLQVADSTDFPSKEEFRIQIKNEFLNVTAVNGTTWTVERGVERTTPGSYPDGTIAELVKFDPDQSNRSLDDFRKLVATSIFVKPAPPYRMKLTPPGEKAFTRGKPLDFSLVVTGYDSLLGKPDFEIVGEAPAGLKLEKTGKFTWNPDNSVPAGKYEVKFDVRHPSAPLGQLTDVVTIRLREPKPVPKLANDKPPKVYLNRGWKFRPELVAAATASPTNPSNLTWKLGDKPPQGMTIDSKTGELSWMPDDAFPIGEITVQLIATDTDLPPLSTTIPLKLEVADDAAQFTRLTGVFTIGENKRALFADQSRNLNSELGEGETFAISELSGKIKEIGSRHIVVTLGKEDLRWEIGDSLREALAKPQEKSLQNKE